MDTQVATLTTKQVAHRLVELCRNGQIEEAQRELFADDAVSVEAAEMPGFPKEVKGLDAILKKGENFNAQVEEIHGSVITEPIVIGNLISIGWSFDATMKGRGRNNMEEICLYKVENGKIKHEQFYY